jgi:hypothetical protein
MKAMRRILLSAALLLAAGSVGIAQQGLPVGTIRFSGGSIAEGVGYTWGRGELTFNGRQYAFTTNGLSVVDPGASRIEGAGDIYDLRRLEDFPGTYVAVTAGATVAGGAAVATLRNHNGVTIRFHATTLGLQLNLSSSGVAIALRQ